MAQKAACVYALAAFFVCVAHRLVNNAQAAAANSE
jgi:hypothetical protein